MNGQLQGSFKGGKGLCQGDPISPLLFVLVIEYLTRALHGAAKDKKFRFHPLCKSLNITNLCFADDLLLVCKAHASSIQIIQQSFETFSAASGLYINNSKSRIFFGGISGTEKAYLLSLSKMTEGSFPLVYLGMPLIPTKWKSIDCDLIILKIRQRLHGWASRNLSYAGRVQLIQSVLMGIRNYWMSIFLLPQKVIKEIDCLCRNFLWGGKGTRSKFHLASWDLVCRPKSYGGLGIKEGSLWNKINFARFIWAISSKQDILWVKWVNCIYLKGVQIWDYELHKDSSWYWKKLIKMSKSSSNSILNEAVIQGKFQLSKLYLLSIPGIPINSMKAVWYNLSVPKHRFILWQVINQKLLTRDLLQHCHIPIISLNCLVCEVELESHSHLFFDCILSKRVLQAVAVWLGGLIWFEKFKDWSSWLNDSRNGGLARVVSATLAATVYYLWLNRNKCCFDSSCYLDFLIKESVKARVFSLSFRAKKQTLREKLMIHFFSSL
ncbi:uncharacterized protein LOC133792093 [Humulus lupulus]|uniref:uncharacterized protein LOC133792093 n=1 Tax=Humulus lupulus TaxID=3486 RepID=UPI002B405475|nr:uncharacterized protein LOC133792093 [Humulus lupulus]